MRIVRTAGISGRIPVSRASERMRRKERSVSCISAMEGCGLLTADEPVAVAVSRVREEAGEVVQFIRSLAAAAQIAAELFKLIRPSQVKPGEQGARCPGRWREMPDPPQRGPPPRREPEHDPVEGEGGGLVHAVFTDFPSVLKSGDTARLRMADRFDRATAASKASRNPVLGCASQDFSSSRH